MIETNPVVPLKRDRPLLGVVGPCAAGKSTLIQSLSQSGISARHIAQEHSYVLDMWQRLSNPIFLIFLDVSFPLTIQRRQLDWREADYQEQIQRLSHARAHADLVIDTDPLSPIQVQQAVLDFLTVHGWEMPGH